MAVNIDAQKAGFNKRITRIRKGRTIQQSRNAEGTRPEAPKPQKVKRPGNRGLMGCVMAAALAGIPGLLLVKRAFVSTAMTNAEMSLPIPGDTVLGDLIVAAMLCIVGMRILSVGGVTPYAVAAAVLAFLFAPVMGAEQVPLPADLWAQFGITSFDQGIELLNTYIVPFFTET